MKRGSSNQMKNFFKPKPALMMVLFGLMKAWTVLGASVAACTPPYLTFVTVFKTVSHCYVQGHSALYQIQLFYNLNLCL